MLLDIHIRDRYYAAKVAMETAYNEFNRNPCLATNDRYKIALTNFQDLCVAEVAKMVGDSDLGRVYEEDSF